MITTAPEQPTELIETAKFNLHVGLLPPYEIRVIEIHSECQGHEAIERLRPIPGFATIHGIWNKDGVWFRLKHPADTFSSDGDFMVIKHWASKWQKIAYRYGGKQEVDFPAQVPTEILRQREAHGLWPTGWENLIQVLLATEAWMAVNCPRQIDSMNALGERCIKVDNYRPWILGEILKHVPRIEA